MGLYAITQLFDFLQHLNSDADAEANLGVSLAGEQNFSSNLRKIFRLLPDIFLCCYRWSNAGSFRIAELPGAFDIPYLLPTVERSKHHIQL